MQPNQLKPDRFDILLRVGAFALIAFVVWIAASGMLAGTDPMLRASLAVLTAGVAANMFLARKFEQGRLADFGFGWQPGSARHCAIGFALGAVALSALILVAVLAGFAEFRPASPDRSPVTITLLLLAGVLGEELFFRGYAFQYLVRAWNPTLTIIAGAAFFGLAHLFNDNAQLLGVLNTVLWGCLLGYSYTRARSLWLPSGVHYGWNLALALFTSNLSGTTIRATAWDLHWSAGELWSGGAYGLEGGLLATLVAVPVFLLVRRVR